ncbi:hypothetical protein JCM14244_14810 [Venenivibrio stagnispumantis]|uniref:Uncharacterized protein n=1 Tax=Venenivibrio stagnispumantis TaxID=407998 RepID=A0AA45WJ12_9AQUI|nr:hypothetical protein [Venenivibrio stagnispumantis]MCW4572539.1 hypothetical protein [Venenivibrio stagnispumantis]SMP01651.1 hypothetical protein SAMN06264868_10214 [Venenivibrio stagnispumantis]
MKKLKLALGVSALIAVDGLSISASKSSDTELLKQAKQYFQPLPKQIPSPKDNPITKEKVELGNFIKLFWNFYIKS